MATFTKQDISGFETKAQEARYEITVKVTAKGETTVTLKGKTGNVFEGRYAVSRGEHEDQVKAYANALAVAVTRMVAYEGRFA